MNRTAVLQLFKDGKVIDSISLSNEDAPIVIGRDPRGHVCLEGEKISRQHAAIEFAGSDFYLRDLASANGTLLNEVPAELERLNSGDVVRIGDFMISVTVAQTRTRDCEADMDVLDTIAVPKVQE